MRLLVATHNPGKLREYRDLLAGLDLELVSLAELGLPDDVAETGETFEANARLKAEIHARRSGLLTLADDSGLEVEALGGEPGVRSKRYAGEGKSDAERVAFLLDKLARVPAGRRAARFVCVIVLAAPDGRDWVAEGICPGEIAFAPRGEGGFGYDPVFLVTGDPHGRTMAELPMEEKNRVSHRGRAAEKAVAILRELVS